MAEIIPFKKKLPACSFCGKPPSSKRKLVGDESGPHICQECVATCNKLIDESDNQSKGE